MPTKRSHPSRTRAVLPHGLTPLPVVRIVQRIAALEIELAFLRDQLTHVERHLGVDRSIED